jgi:dephospho-CoA kinase
MLIIGLTGSIGMGKSTVAKRFVALGVPVCDADALVHELYRSAAVAPIEAAFPGTTTKAGVDRQKLGALLLVDPSGFKRLEAIVHPLVFAAERHFLSTSHSKSAKFAVLEIPLLFETNGDRRVDIIVVVSAPADKQRERVLARPGMTEAKFTQILSRQLSDADKRSRATYVVETGGTLDETDAQIDSIVTTLKDREGTAFDRHWK